MGHDRRAGSGLQRRLPDHLRRYGEPAADEHVQAASGEARIERALAGGEVLQCRTAGGVSIKLDVDAAAGIADSGDAEQDLAGLLREIGEVAQANQMGALFLIDEMQNLDTPSLSAIVWPFKPSAAPDYPWPWWVQDYRISGCGFSRPSLTPTASSPMSNSVAFPKAPPVPPSSVRLRRPAPTTTRKRPARSCMKQRVFPTSFKSTGRELWNFAETTPITLADLDSAREIVKDSLARNFFGTRFEMATDTEQRYLSAMASLGEGPYPLAKSLTLLGSATNDAHLCIENR